MQRRSFHLPHNPILPWNFYPLTLQESPHAPTQGRPPHGFRTTVLNAAPGFFKASSLYNPLPHSVSSLVSWVVVVKHKKKSHQRCNGNLMHGNYCSIATYWHCLVPCSIIGPVLILLLLPADFDWLRSFFFFAPPLYVSPHVIVRPDTSVFDRERCSWQVGAHTATPDQLELPTPRSLIDAALWRIGRIFKQHFGELLVLFFKIC